MLSLSKCRSILGKEAEGKTDAEIIELLDSLYAIAHITFNVFEEGKKRDAHSPTAKGFSKAMTLILEKDRIVVDERASIIEFEANLDRDEAEHRAVLLYLDQYPKKGRNHDKDI